MDKIQCPYCPQAHYTSGTENVFRHLMLDHPESSRARAIFLALASRPLPRPEDTIPGLPLSPQTERAGIPGGGRARGPAPSHPTGSSL
jgi:hypothetical protein